MPLLNTTAKINSEIVQTIRSAANHNVSSIVHANQIVQIPLTLNDVELSDWLNSYNIEEMETLFSAHHEYGSAMNAAAKAAEDILKSSGFEVSIPRVDVRSVVDKLADQRRTMNFVDGKWVIETLPIKEIAEEDE